MFDMRLQFVIVLTLTPFFLLCFFVLLKKIPRPKLRRQIFHRLKNLILVASRETQV